MEKNNYPALISFLIATVIVAFFIFSSIIQWEYLYNDYLQHNHYLYYFLLKIFNFSESEYLVQSSFRFLFAFLLLFYITKLILEKPRELPHLLILMTIVGWLFSFVIKVSFFKFSSICAFLLLGLAVFSKKRDNSIFLTALALMSNITTALTFGIVLCLADQFRRFRFFFRPRFFLIMIDGGLLALIFFILILFFSNESN